MADIIQRYLVFGNNFKPNDNNLECSLAYVYVAYPMNQENGYTNLLTNLN